MKESINIGIPHSLLLYIFILSLFALVIPSLTTLPYTIRDHQWYQSQWFHREKNTPPQPQQRPPPSPTSYNHSTNLLKLIFQTIHRQVLGLVTTWSYYNYHQYIAYPNEPPFWLRIGGLPFTGNIHQVYENFVLQEKYWDSYIEQENVQEETLNSRESELDSLEIEE